MNETNEVFPPRIDLAARTEDTVSAFFDKGPRWLRQRTILLTRAGSWALGLALPTSDVDLRGVCIAPPPVYTGFSQRFERHPSKDPDGEVTELRVFLRAAVVGEPAVLQSLFCDPEDVLHVTPVGLALRAMRSSFLSKAIARPFVGHARGLIAKVRHHSKLDAPTRDVGKDAMHAELLTRQLCEVLLGEGLSTRRRDSWSLMAIRKHPADAPGWVAETEQKLSHLKDWLDRSELPEHPAVEEIDAFCSNVVRMAIAGGPEEPSLFSRMPTRDDNSF